MDCSNPSKIEFLARLITENTHYQGKNSPIDEQSGESNKKKKSRIVVHAVGSKDSDKELLVIYSPTISHASSKTTIRIGAVLKFPMFIRDISQAYVSSDS